MSVVNPLAQAILQAAVDDWVPLHAIEGMARRLGYDTEDKIQLASIEAIRELATKGFAHIGEVSDGGFFEWPTTVGEAVERVRDIWEKTDRDVWGFAVWLASTPAGDAQAGGQEFRR